MSLRGAEYDGVSISELYELEEKGRTGASQGDQEMSHDFDGKLLMKMAITAGDIDRVAAQYGDQDIGEMAVSINRAIYDWISRNAYNECVRKKMPRNKCIIPEGVKETLNYVDRTYNKWTGEERCTWLLGIKEPYAHSTFLNDVTACFHRLTEMVEKRATEEEVVVKKCRMKEGGNRTLFDACKKWNRKVEDMKRQGLYMEDDYRPLLGNVLDSKAVFVVGSSPGHRTHVDLAEGEIRYYDNDRPVNELMRDILGETGLKCKVKEDGVECKGLTEENLGSAVERLAVATSADYRLGDPDHFWPEDLMGKCMVKVDYRSPKYKVEVEKCLLKESGLIG